MKDYLKVVVTGEVDSGKSTLIGRFLYELGSFSRGAVEEIAGAGNAFEFAYLLDSLEEERRNQLTLDTTQAFSKTKRGREFVFIDVPGHQELIKNMLSGSSYADIAVLVIDAQQAIGEQTKRHAFVLRFLGIEQVIVVLNKMDLVGFKKGVFENVRGKIRSFLEKIEIQVKYFVPISAREGENLLRKSKKMAWYRGLSLLEALNLSFIRKRNNAFRFPIQDMYRLNAEEIAVGRIVSGKIKNGERVTVLPLHKESCVKKIRVFPKDRREARAPESIGLLLDDMHGLRRGEIICKRRLPAARTEILTKIFCVHSLNVKERLKFRCATQESVARFKEIHRVWDTARLGPRAKKNVLEKTYLAEALIATEDPVVVESFAASDSLGRFVLQKDKDICAIGIVL